MVCNISQTIDFAIEKKLNNGIGFKNSLKELAKFSKYNTLKQQQLNNFAGSFENFSFSDVNSISAQRDVYNNQLHNYLKVKKTQCKFNLIKLFEPGEILNAIISN